MTAANHRNIVWLQLEQELGDTSAAIIDAVETVGSAFVQPSDSNLKHLGEAHMLLMAERLRNRWTMCFEDRDARRFAEGCTR